ncbi:MAG TPA: hypothetical protein VFN75_11660 [Pseudonocardiaceae bacterium]|nr:hypothetical protein [Pseudonocardiaceae bacterium]
MNKLVGFGRVVGGVQGVVLFTVEVVSAGGPAFLIADLDSGGVGAGVEGGGDCEASA